MTISLNPFTHKHKKKALTRIFRELILREIKWAYSNKFYL